MIVRLPPEQIPTFWESIKFCAISGDEISAEDRPKYLNILLHNLLANKTQCFVRLDDARILTAMVITRVEVDKLTAIKQLYMQGLYSLRMTSDKIWKDEFSLIEKFARSQGCSQVVFSTRHKAVMRLGEALGFIEFNRTFKFSLGGSHGK